ncbi:hypothetical protein BJ684DRAFT_20498 [Piptocephalis cylindrospora]|uniref:RGS domain-containing protein n=1 Tax=Piptocephalis cylindrospora TaxID=1907219 RepID=A0A4V1IY16_9FUNG|nr:hypothetical protein BJ684DRAFT_20498 [Piptocephalis cylindrospora]|eukprot:RKP12989.1 hypothetical protein BJ684DRAFT_20498 [Piptocephalis cylindrospora]
MDNSIPSLPPGILAGNLLIESPEAITRKKWIFWSIMVVWDILTIVLTYLFYRRRHNPAIRHRSVPLTIAQVVVLAIIINVFLGREPEYLKFPCFVSLWVLSIALPLAVYLLAARSLRLAFLYRYSQYLVLARSVRSSIDTSSIGVSSASPRPSVSKPYVSSPQYSNSLSPNDALNELPGTPGLVSSFSRPDSPPTGKSRGDTSYSLDRPVTASNHALLDADIDDPSGEAMAKIIRAENSWIMRYRHLLTTRKLVQWVGCIVLFHVVVTFGVECFTTEFAVVPHIARGNCQLGWEYYPLYAFCGFAIAVIMPFLLWTLKGVKDDYGIKLELYICLGLWAAFFIWYLIVAYVPYLQIHLDTKFPASMWPCIAEAVTFLVCVLRPLYLSYRTERTHKALHLTKTSFEEVLASPSQLALFRAFSIRDFSSENVLFYERVSGLTSRVARAAPHGQKDPARLDRVIARECRAIYELFIEPGSEHEVNLTSSVVIALADRFSMEDLSLDMFDDSLQEIKVLMYQHTFPRFVRSRAESS